VSLDLVVNACVLGAVYLLFTTGFTLVYGTFQVMNLAHGTILVAGAFVGILVANTADLPLAAAVLAAAVAAGLLNVFMDAVVIRPIKRASATYSRGADELSPIIATLSFGAILAAVIQNYATNSTYRFDNIGNLGNPHDLLGIRLSTLEITILVGAAVLAGGTYWLIDRTQLGITIRSVAEDSFMASALGVRTARVSAAVFFLSGALAGISGVAVGLLYTSVTPIMGAELLLYGFVIATIGGLGSLAGTAMASFIVAFARTLASEHFTGSAVDIWVFSLLLLVLLVRPAGLMGKKVLSSGVVRT
jgi:branched-subunit amino acid ABC-type transport system permease component